MFHLRWKPWPATLWSDLGDRLETLLEATHRNWRKTLLLVDTRLPFWPGRRLPQ